MVSKTSRQSVMRSSAMHDMNELFDIDSALLDTGTACFSLMSSYLLFSKKAFIDE